MYLSRYIHIYTHNGKTKANIRNPYPMHLWAINYIWFATLYTYICVSKSPKTMKHPSGSKGVDWCCKILDAQLQPLSQSTHATHWFTHLSLSPSQSWPILFGYIPNCCCSYAQWHLCLFNQKVSDGSTNWSRPYLARDISGDVHDATI